MKKFEYRTLEVPVKSAWTGSVDQDALIGQLNELGKNGWEVLSQPLPDRYAGTKKPLIILKREIN